jgi:hypothetical protein
VGGAGRVSFSIALLPQYPYKENLTMILYKYSSAKTAAQILANGSLWFSVATQMNDPFETKAGAGLVSADKLKFWAEFKRNLRNDTEFRTLCLTREPLSPLMWAHYADQHRGIVLGFDAELAGLNDFSNCVIPAQHGSIRYTRTKPKHGYQALEPLANGPRFADCFDPQSLTFFERNFLFKSAEWHYEEEVRIIKTANSLIDNSTKVNAEYNPPNGMQFSIPAIAIKEIYLGQRFYINDEDQMRDIFKFISAAAPDAALFDGYPDDESWRMLSRQIDNVETHLDDIFHPS